jgi:hypothetical protein
MKDGILNKACLVEHSQFTVVGTVKEAIKNDKNSNDYSITLQVECALASFPEVSAPENMVGQNITVSGWGDQRPECKGANKDFRGSNAKLNDRMIYFIHLTKDKKGVYTNASPCAGGIPLDDKSIIEQVLQSNWDHYIGLKDESKEECKISKPTVTPKPVEIEDATAQGFLADIYGLAIFLLML